MSVAYFIVLDKEDVDFDTFVNGKNIAHAFDELFEFCKTNNLKTIDYFYSQNISEFMEDYDDIEYQEQEVKWFCAQEGIDWVTLLIEKIQSEETKFNKDAVIEDFQEYLDVFQNVKKVDAKWHLELDY